MIRLKNVSFCYEGAAENSLANMNLHVEPGECVVLTGPSGCGKTTVTRLVNGLAPHFYPGALQGKVLAGGKSVPGCEPHELSGLVGSVFQNPRTQFFNTDTTSELVFGMENKGLAREEMAARLDKAVAELGLAHLLGRDIFALSGGEKQRIAFGGVYALSPAIYVMDEPTANLDTAAIAQLREALLHVKKQGKTILIAEHRLHYLRDIADRIVLLEKGTIRQQWTADTFAALDNRTIAAHGLRPFAKTVVKICHEGCLDATPALEVKNLCLAYERKTILSGVSFAAGRGEIVGMIAPNGTGKTTLARAICGLHNEASGQVLFRGNPVKLKRRNRHAYLVMQDPNYQLFSDSVEGELGLFVSEAPPKEEADDILEMLELSAFRQRHPLSLSGGQKQRLAVALAALSPAKVLIFDEPTSGLDLANMQRVVEMLRLLAGRGKSILVITHDDEFLLMGCDRVIGLPEPQSD